MSTSNISAAKNIVTNPSESGPNVAMNTQETIDGEIVTNPTKSDLPGQFDSDWRETQWNAGSTFDPLAGRENVNWGGVGGYSVGYWQQGSATSKSGMSSYAVYQNPDTSDYAFAMTVQGGKYNNQQLSTAVNFGSAFSLDHPIVLTSDISVSGFSGSTGYIEGGINFTLQFDDGATQYGLFLQIPIFDGRGAPVSYASLYDKSAMIFNVTGEQSTYVGLDVASGSGTTYRATVDLNKSLQYAIKAIANVYKSDASALQNLSNWHLTGMYFGIESNGTGLASDQKGTLTVANPIITYDDAKTVSYDTLLPSSRALSLAAETVGSAAATVIIPGQDVNIKVFDQGSNSIGRVINDYADSISKYASSGVLKNSVLVTGANAGAGTADSPAQGIIDATGNYIVNGDYAYLYVGAMGDQAPQNRVSLDATANTAAFLQVISNSEFGVDVKFGDKSGAFAATSGDNKVDASLSRKVWRIATGDGNDTIIGSQGTNTIDAGGGNNAIYLGGSNNYVRSSGQDTINGVQGAIDTVSLIGGNSFVNLYTNAAVVDLSTGNSISVGDNSTVFGGTHSRISIVNGSATVVGATEDTISAAGNLTITHGTNLTLSVGGALTFIAGTGSTNLLASSGVVYGAADLNLSLSASDRMTFTANQPNAWGDQYVDATHATGDVSFWTGAGNQTIRGGSGTDQFYFGTSFAGVSNHFAAATVSGGSGAGNLFGMLSNHTAGDFYITDFRVAHDKFFLYLFHPRNAAQATQNLLDSATVSGGNTSLLIDGNARVTFLGVTNLKASDISYS